MDKNENKGKLIIVDGMSLIYRAYYGWPVNENSKVPNNAVQGFFTWIAKLVDDYNPTHLFIAFDAYGPSFRKDELPTYKDGRQKTPDDLISQVPIIKQGLEKLGVKFLEVPGFEADDIAASLATSSAADGFEVLVVSADKDLIQLVDNNISIIVPIRGLREVDIITPERASEKYGIPANRYRELAALVGEKADNLPGIAGVGPKTAVNLINASENFEELLENTANKPGKVYQAIHDGVEIARLNYKLNKLVTDMELTEVGLDLLALALISDYQLFDSFCQEFEIDRIGHKVSSSLNKNSSSPSRSAEEIISLEEADGTYGSYVQGELIPFFDEEPPPPF